MGTGSLPHPRLNELLPPKEHNSDLKGLTWLSMDFDASLVAVLVLVLVHLSLKILLNSKVLEDLLKHLARPRFSD